MKAKSAARKPHSKLGDTLPPLPQLHLPQTTPLEDAIIQHLSIAPEISVAPPEGMQDEDFLFVSLVCERMNHELSGLTAEVYKGLLAYGQSELPPGKHGIRLRYVSMDLADWAGAQSGRSPEELVRFIVADFYEKLRDEVIIALTPASLWFLTQLKEFAADYPDRGERFLTLRDALDDETLRNNKIANPLIRERYINAALRRLITSYNKPPF